MLAENKSEKRNASDKHFLFITCVIYDMAGGY